MSKYMLRAVQRQAIVLLSLCVKSPEDIYYIQGGSHIKALVPIKHTPINATTPTPINIHLIISFLLNNIYQKLDLGQVFFKTLYVTEFPCIILFKEDFVLLTGKVENTFTFIFF